MIGEPAPWDWHRLLSGLSTDVDVLALGEQRGQGLRLDGPAVRERARPLG